MDNKEFASMFAKGRCRIAMQHCANFAERCQMRQKATIMRSKVKTSIKITPHQINSIGKAQCSFILQKSKICIFRGSSLPVSALGKRVK
jgi:hypothetical protein